MTVMALLLVALAIMLLLVFFTLIATIVKRIFRFSKIGILTTRSLYMTRLVTQVAGLGTFPFGRTRRI